MANPTSSVRDDAHVNGLLAALYRAADGIALIAGFLAAGCIVALTGLILTEIIVAFLARFISALPSGIHIGWEYSAYLMGGAFMLGSGMTLRAGQQIRVEMLLKVKGGRYTRWFESCSCVIGSATMVFLAYTMSIMTVRMYVSGEASQDSFTPLWIPQSALTLGAIILAVQMVLRLIACLIEARIERPELGAATLIE